MSEPVNNLPAVPRWSRACSLRTLARALVALAVLAAGLEISRVCFGRNLHTTIPGRVYRCAQPSPGDLQDLIRAHGIRTVVNLRGECEPNPWYLAESKATQDLDVCQEDVGLSAGRLPSASELRRFVEVLDRTEYPILLHCRRGADRTGLAAAIIQLLQADVPFDRGRAQLGWRFGHLALGRPANLDHFFTLYEDWLEAQRLEHAPQVFRRWLFEEYHGGCCCASLSWVATPAEAPRNRAVSYKVKAVNRGTGTWHFHPSGCGGVHAGLFVWDGQDRLVGLDKFGLYHASVAPGESIELTVVLPALEKAGRYRVMIDLIEENHSWFYQLGSEPLEGEIRIRE